MKHKKRHRKPSPSPRTDSNPALARIKERIRRIDRQDVIQTALWLVGVFLFYTVCNHLRLTFHVILYPIALGALAVGYFLLNGGTFERNSELDPSRFPEDWDEERREKETARFYRNRALAKRLLPPLFAVITTLCIDLIYLNVVSL